MVIVWNGICLNERSWKVPRLPTSIDACKVFAGTMHLVRELCTTGSPHSRMEGSQQMITRDLDVHQTLSQQRTSRASKIRSWKISACHSPSSRQPLALVATNCGILCAS